MMHLILAILQLATVVALENSTKVVVMVEKEMSCNEVLRFSGTHHFYPNCANANLDTVFTLQYLGDDLEKDLGKLRKVSGIISAGESRPIRAVWSQPQ